MYNDQTWKGSGTLETNITVTVKTSFWHSYKPEVPKDGETEISGTIEVQLKGGNYQFGWERPYGTKESMRLANNDNLVFFPGHEAEEFGGWLVAYFADSVAVASPRDWHKIENGYRDSKGVGRAFEMIKKVSTMKCFVSLDNSELKALTEFCEKYGTKTKLEELIGTSSERLACGPYCQTHGGAWPSDSIPDDNIKRPVHVDTCEVHGVRNCQSCHQ